MSAIDPRGQHTHGRPYTIHAFKPAPAEPDSHVRLARLLVSCDDPGIGPYFEVKCPLAQRYRSPLGHTETYPQEEVLRIGGPLPDEGWKVLDRPLQTEQVVAVVGFDLRGHLAAAGFTRVAEYQGSRWLWTRPADPAEERDEAAAQLIERFLAVESPGGERYHLTFAASAYAVLPSPRTLSALVLALHERKQPSRAMLLWSAAAANQGWFEAMAREDANR